MGDSKCIEVSEFAQLIGYSPYKLMKKNTNF